MGKLKNGCSIYLVFAGKKVKLPVNPEEIEIKHPTNHKTYDVIGVGEIVVPRKLMLSRLVDTFFSRTSWTMLLYAGNHSISVA